MATESAAIRSSDESLLQPPPRPEELVRAEGLYPFSRYAFFTNSDFSFMAPKPSIWQSML